MRAHWIKAAIAILLLALSTACSKQSEAQTKTGSDDEVSTVAIEKVQRSNLASSLTLTAEFIPYQEVDVMAKIPGYIKKIHVDIGDRVRAGQLLALLEAPEMNDDLSRAAAALQRTDAEIKRAQGDLARAKASYDIAHLSYQRLDGVSQSKPGLVAQQEVDDAKSKDLTTEAQVAAAQSNLMAAEQQTAVSRAEQDRYKTLYNYTRVIAPFDGVVTKRYGNTGSMIQAGISSQTQAMPVVRLSQNSLLRLMLPVPESAVSGIHLGQSVEVHVSSLNRSFKGKVARFSNKVATSTRTMETEVDVPNPKLLIIPGMYAEVQLELESSLQALSIPVSAADVNGTESRVYKVTKDNKIAIVPVKLGLETASRVEVLSGLNEGDGVVIGARAGLKAGDAVKPQVVTIAQPKADS